MRQVLIGGRYRLLRLVGSGGMGRVWLARDEMLHRDVAVKEVVPPSWLDEEERDTLRDRTMREARHTARLNHPNVVRVYDVVNQGDNPWIVMEYVPSRSLHEVLTTDGPVSPERAAEIGLAVLAALRAAHAAGVLHRDVKPHNVLVAEDGRVVLTDFGLARADDDGRMTRPGMVMGSPQYVAPERAAEGVSTVEADLWSLGATLYAAVEGHSPYARKTSMATLTALATVPPDPAPHAGALRPVLDGLLRRDARQRLSTDEAERLLLRVRDGRSAGRTGGGGRSGSGAGSGPGSGSGADTRTGTGTGGEPARAARPGAATVTVDEAAGVAATGIRSSAPPADGRSGRHRRRLAVAAAAVVVVATGAAIALWQLDDARRPGATGLDTTATPTPAATGTGPGTAAAAARAAFPCASPPAGATPVTAGPRPRDERYALIAGWTWYVDPTGFRIAAPVGWLTWTDGPVRCVKEPDGGRVLSVDPSTPPTDRPADYLAAEERRLTNGGLLPGYQKVMIQAIDSYGGAEWECRWTNASGVPVHAYRMLANAGDGAYTIAWQTREFDWSVNKANLLMVRQSFRPAT